MDLFYSSYTTFPVILHNPTPAATVRGQRLIRTDPGESHGLRLHDVLSDAGESQYGVDSEVRAHIRGDVVHGAAHDQDQAQRQLQGSAKQGRQDGRQRARNLFSRSTIVPTTVFDVRF